MCILTLTSYAYACDNRLHVLLTLAFLIRMIKPHLYSFAHKANPFTATSQQKNLKCTLCIWFFKTQTWSNQSQNSKALSLSGLFLCQIVVHSRQPLQLQSCAKEGSKNIFMEGGKYFSTLLILASGWNVFAQTFQKFTSENPRAWFCSSAPFSLCLYVAHGQLTERKASTRYHFYCGAFNWFMLREGQNQPQAKAIPAPIFFGNLWPTKNRKQT